MLGIARRNPAERAELFQVTAAETGLPEAIVEKDFWVCYTLDLLFHRSPFVESVIFKGGTSLSKAFGVIERFSEDIDLILDWRLLGYGEREPWEERSNTKQDRFVKESVGRTDAYLAGTFVPALREGLSEELGREADVRMGEDPETVLFAYPRAYSLEATLDVIKLEIGPLAAWSPSRPATIEPYAAELHPQIFSRPSTTVRTAVPERTFWEKATILHQEANRPEGKPMPRRYSRHYYDMYMLGHSDVAAAAIARPDLLADVVTFKEKFYRTPWAHLPEAVPGTLRLVPPGSRTPELEADYDAMRPMIFGARPPLGDILSYLADLEGRINSGATG